MANERRITYGAAKDLPGSNDGEFIANNAGNYRDPNHGVYVGEWSVIHIVQNSVEIIIYKLR
jgi:hypothetical protein